MNKLNELLIEFTEAFTSIDPGEPSGVGGNDPRDADWTFDTSPQEVFDWLREKFPEYARSKVPEEIEMPTGDAVRFAYDKEHYTGYNHCVRVVKSDIDQDLLALKEKNI